MSAVYNRSRENHKYDLKIALYDGYYRDNLFFDIIIAGDELNFSQKVKYCTKQCFLLSGCTEREKPSCIVPINVLLSYIPSSLYQQD